ncbi:hypothetical protein CRYUN_Cryun03dG0030300 [Craigia yunnanensis]
MQMGFGNSQLSQGSKWLVLLLKVGIMGMIMLDRVTSEDEMGTPSAGLLCISDCATCPVICSPPPPPLLKSYPPPAPSVHHSPPPVPYYYIPPQSYYHSPPPSESVSPPSPSPPRPPPPVPSSYSSKGSPPPPFKYFFNAPPGQGPPTVGGPHEYPYPYYYFYASKASSLYFQASLSLGEEMEILQDVPRENMGVLPAKPYAAINEQAYAAAVSLKHNCVLILEEILFLIIYMRLFLMLRISLKSRWLTLPFVSH